MRVLIADSDEAFLEVAQRYLSHRGHEAETASNGLECVASLLRDMPDVVVLEKCSGEAAMVSGLSCSKIPGGPRFL